MSNLRRTSNFALFTGETPREAILRGALIGVIPSAAVSAVAPELLKTKIRTVGALGAVCIAGGFLSDYLVDKSRTGKQMERLSIVSQSLAYLGGIGVGGYVGSMVGSKLAVKNSPAAFNGESFDKDPIVLAAQRL